METLKDFKELVEKYLRQEGHSQAYFAEKLGYRPDRLNKWLLGVNKIPYGAVCKICSALHLDKRQQVQLFALAGYPLPKWVADVVTVAEPHPRLGTEGVLGFDPALMGNYEGESQEQEVINNKNEPIPDTENIEQFSIDLMKGWVRITGESFLKTTKKRASTWHGRLWKVENENTLYFAIELDTGNRELGTLILTCQNGKATGWFYSGRDNRRLIYEFGAKKVDFFSLLAAG